MSGRARVKPTEQPPTDAAGDHVVKARPERRKDTKLINCDVVADNLFTIMVQQPDAVPLRPLKLGNYANLQRVYSTCNIWLALVVHYMCTTSALHVTTTRVVSA